MLYKQIILEWGQDTESGVWGLGYSPDNGKNFYVLNTTHGRKYRAEDGNRLYPYISDQVQDKIDTAVTPAKSAADSAQSAADAAIASAQVTSYAVSAINSATAEAAKGADEALSQAKSAWAEATTATGTASSAQSNAQSAIAKTEALSTNVNVLQGTVTTLQAESTTQADEIKNKVTQSDVTGMLTGYATQEYTQSLVTQKADDWNLNLTKLKNDTQTSVTNLSATVDGIQAQVYNSDGSSKITQLSNLIATKVSQDDYNSQITQLNNDINMRVKSADLISQINLQAGTALIQSNKLVLDAGTTVFTGDAFIPDAYISTLNADKLIFYGSDGTSATMGASVAQYDDDKTKSTINLQYSGGIEIHSSDQQGSILTMHDNTIRLASKTWGDNPNAYQYSGFYAAPNYSLMNTYHRDGTTSGVAIDDNQIHIYGSSKDQQLGALQADVGWYSINGKTGLLTGNQITLKSGNTNFLISDGMAKLYQDNNDSQTATKLEVHGWAWVNGWVEAAGHSQHSALSTKTDLQTIDDDEMLEMVNNTDLASFLFKTDVASGETHRHIGLIIDDVHDVAQYQTPQDFIAPNGVSRDDDNMIGALFGAVKALTKRIKALEEKTK